LKIVKLSDQSIRISAHQYGFLRRSGIIVGTPDLLIAGIAIADNLTLVPNNVKDIRLIEELTFENWKDSAADL